MKYITFLFPILLFSCKKEVKTDALTLDEIFNSKFEHSLISRGDNFPDFYSKRDSLDKLLVALHYNIDLKDFQSKVGWTDSTLQNKLDLLKSKNWLSMKDGLKPSIFIASDAEGLKLMELAKPISTEIARSIEEEIPNVKKDFAKTDLSKKQSFTELSFLILSDVLLDNWQINGVEKEFLQKNERPERHGKYYYYSIIQNPNYPKEKFGIYGNQYGKLNDSTSFSVYGNNRITLLKRIKSDSVFKDSVLQTAAILSTKDDKIFEQMAAKYRPKLIEILNSNREYMNKVFLDTGYNNEISFEEFFIWWYHLIYTDATNILASKGKLELPKDGNFPYLIK